MGKIDTSLLSKGSKALIADSKSQMAMWPALGQYSYITPAILGVSNAHSGD